MKMETERLELIALTAPRLRLWVHDIKSLEAELCCAYRGEPMEGLFKEIVEGQLEATEKDTENYMWHSFWLIIRKSDRAAVGSADFKNVPDAEGEVEIGYGLGEPFQHNGYMTESVQAMCVWALRQNGVRHVIAETELDGHASQNISRRCGFTEYRRDKTVWWRL